MKERRKERREEGDKTIGEVLALRTYTGELFTINFSVEELRCRCKLCNKTVKHNMQESSLVKHQTIRTSLGRAFRPSSAFRCKEHPKEAGKPTPGEHNRTAMDYPVQGGIQRAEIVQLALEQGAKGIGLARTFVHVDFREGELRMWVY